MNIFSTTKPQFHFSAKTGWINDPNGLIFMGNRYHMFYQYFPDGLVWGPMHWGHAVSEDLLQWKEEEIALYPNELGMIFSGSAVKKNGSREMIAYFTNHLEKDGVKTEVQSMAYSDSDGRKWRLYENNPILIDENESDFRDPKVLYMAEKNIWIMVVAAGKKVNFYSSEDGIHWKRESSFTYEGLPSGVWECPELLKLRVKNSDEEIWALKADIVCDDRESISYIFFGEFDGLKFTMLNTDSLRNIDQGRDFYAAQSWFGTENKNIWIGWMSDWKYANLIPCSGSRGTMTIPREITAVKSGEKKYYLEQKPVSSFYEKLMGLSKTINLKLNSDEEREIFDGEFSCFSASNKNSEDFTLRIGNSAEFIKISYSSENNGIIFDRADSGIVDFQPSFKEKVEFHLEESLENIEILLDKNSAEIFLNDGKYVITSLVFPTKPYENIKVINGKREQQFHEVAVKKVYL